MYAPADIVQAHIPVPEKNNNLRRPILRAKLHNKNKMEFSLGRN